MASCASSKARARPKCRAADRRTRHGRPALARQRRLCALCLGLSEFPRGARLQHADRRTLAWRGTGRRAATQRENARAGAKRKGGVTARLAVSQSLSAEADEDNVSWRRRLIMPGAAGGRLRPIRPSALCSSRTVSSSAVATTQPGGRPHAETIALQQAGAAAAGATLYVTLEPCSHHGKTPPCAEAIIAAGVARVVSAIEDPDRRVAGRGHAMLRCRGHEVATGVLRRTAARRANLGHILRVTAGRPMVTLKLARDGGRLCCGAPGPRLDCITGAVANEPRSYLRAQHDAIMVGVGTALADDPLLTVRLPGLGERSPLRIVLDTRLALRLASRLALTRRASHPTLVIAGEDAPEMAAVRLAAIGDRSDARMPRWCGACRSCSGAFGSWRTRSDPYFQRGRSACCSGADRRRFCR